MNLRLPRRHLLALIATAPIAFSSLPCSGPGRQDPDGRQSVSDPVTLDPARCVVLRNFVQYNLHEPLVHVTRRSQDRAGPGQRRDAGSFDYRFTLKPNLTFMTARRSTRRCESHFDRMLDPATASPRRSELTRSTRSRSPAR